MRETWLSSAHLLSCLQDTSVQPDLLSLLLLLKWRFVVGMMRAASPQGSLVVYWFLVDLAFRVRIWMSLVLCQRWVTMACLLTWQLFNTAGSPQDAEMRFDSSLMLGSSVVRVCISPDKIINILRHVCLNPCGVCKIILEYGGSIGYITSISPDILAARS